HGFMFDPGRDDVPPFRVLLEETADGPIVRFRAAGGKHDFIRLGCAKQARDLLARLLDCRFHFSPTRMGRRGVSVILSQERTHRFHDFGSNTRSGVVIEINHLSYTPAYSASRSP